MCVWHIFAFLFAWRTPDPQSIPILIGNPNSSAQQFPPFRVVPPFRQGSQERSLASQPPPQPPSQRRCVSPPQGNGLALNIWRFAGSQPTVPFRAFSKAKGTLADCPGTPAAGQSAGSHPPAFSSSFSAPGPPVDGDGMRGSSHPPIHVGECQPLPKAGPLPPLVRP